MGPRSSEGRGKGEGERAGVLGCWVVSPGTKQGKVPGLDGVEMGHSQTSGVEARTRSFSRGWIGIARII